MTPHMTLSQNHHMVPTQLEDMIEEVEGRLLWILNRVWEVINNLQDIIDELELLQGVYVKVCRTLLQGCMRLRHDIRQLESEVSNYVY